MRLYEQLIEIEQRLIPTGLHVFGRGAELKEKRDLLRMVASFDRPEHGVQSLPRVVAEGLGVEAHRDAITDATSNETKEFIDGIVDESISRFCRSGTEDAVNWLET